MIRKKNFERYKLNRRFDFQKAASFFTADDGRKPSAANI